MIAREATKAHVPEFKPKEIKVELPGEETKTNAGP